MTRCPCLKSPRTILPRLLAIPGRKQDKASQSLKGASFLLRCSTARMLCIFSCRVFVARDRSNSWEIANPDRDTVVWMGSTCPCAICNDAGRESGKSAREEEASATMHRTAASLMSSCDPLETNSSKRLNSSTKNRRYVVCPLTSSVLGESSGEAEGTNVPRH